MNEQTIGEAAQIVSAYVAHNPIAVAEIPTLIRSIAAALDQLANGEPEKPAQKPFVPVKFSVTQDYVVCLEDGKKLKMLKRYLRSRYNLTPEGYRAKWGLPADYPMVAPGYAASRSVFAKRIGLGRRIAPVPPTLLPPLTPIAPRGKGAGAKKKK